MPQLYDIGIIGGGLGGLTLAIEASQQGYSVVLYEKEEYPFHKVCGEYISMESWNFLERCGVPLDSWDLPKINRLKISAPSGKEFSYDLPLGGFGISRFKLDHTLYETALKLGVKIHTATRVNDVTPEDEHFMMASDTVSSNARVVVGAFGKRANLDVKWGRSFVQQKATKINNFIGVKYHIDFPQPLDTISLHNFKNGYCGISAIEDNRYCLCYLTTAANLADSGNSIPQMEASILSKNKHLAHIFSNARFLYEKPLTISQISFNKKQQVMDHILFAGDAAGSITPLCGNGMSMAMHAGHLALEQIGLFLHHKISRNDMESAYAKNWQKQFANRTATGRMVQRFFGGTATELFLSVVGQSKFLSRKLIEQTHGSPF
jgi:flavin-dependent dehydrogenase